MTGLCLCYTPRVKRAMPAPILPLIEGRDPLARAWRPHRPRSRTKDHRRRCIRPRSPPGDRRRNAPPQGLQGRCGAAIGNRGARRYAVGFVLGLPCNMDGSEGPRAQSTRAFARQFFNLTGLAIALWDGACCRPRRRARADRDGRSAAPRRAEVIDEHAAIFILQGALDRPFCEPARGRLRMQSSLLALLPVISC